MSAGIVVESHEIVRELSALPYLKENGLDGIPKTISKVVFMGESLRKRMVERIERKWKSPGALREDVDSSIALSNASSELNKLVEDIERSSLFIYLSKNFRNLKNLDQERKDQLIECLKFFKQEFTQQINDLNKKVEKITRMKFTYKKKKCFLF